MLSVPYAECPYMLGATYAESLYVERHYMLGATYAECHLFWVSLMLSVTLKPFQLSVIMLSVVMLSVVATS